MMKPYFKGKTASTKSMYSVASPGGVHVGSFAPSPYTSAPFKLTVLMFTSSGQLTVYAQLFSIYYTQSQHTKLILIHCGVHAHVVCACTVVTV